MNRLFIVLLAVIIPNITFSQQLPLFTQYRHNQGIINPASINADFFTFEQNISFGASYRLQWNALTAAPKTQTLHGEYFQNSRGGVNLLAGGYLINDQTGPTGFTGIYGRIGGVITSDPDFSGLSFGLNVGAVQYRVNTEDLRLRDEGDIIVSENQNQIYPDVGIGAFAYTTLEGGMLDDAIIFGGLSVPQVIGLDLEFENENGTFKTQRIQHIYAQAGMYHFFRNESFLEISTWLKYAPNVPVNADFNLRYQMQSNFWTGAGMSTAGNLHFEAGFILGGNVGFDNTLRIGYGYDYSISSFGPYVGNTHEINLAFSLQR